MPKLETIIFIFFSLLIVVFAYLPALGYNTDNILNPDCSTTNTCTRYIYTYQKLSHTLVNTWTIDQFVTSIRGEPNPKPFSIVENCAGTYADLSLWKDGQKIKEDIYCNPTAMGLGSSWEFGWTFMGVPDGVYEVQLFFFENTVNNKITGIEKRTVSVT